jgi:hypothetical protein
VRGSLVIILPVPSFSRVSVFGIEPDMIQDGSTIPIARIFQDIIQKSVMMLPLGAVDDGEHSQNEKINRSVGPYAREEGLHVGLSIHLSQLTFLLSLFWRLGSLTD